jgi:hypothetical protein
MVQVIAEGHKIEERLVAGSGLVSFTAPLEEQGVEITAGRGCVS